jgi:mono/diheme cytochrome c family protein
MRNAIGYWLLAAALIILITTLPSALQAQQTQTAPAPASPVTGNAANGKALYYSYGCYACHGYTGETGPRPFVGRWGHLTTEQTFITFLRGRVNVAPVVPSGSMPNFSADVLPDKKARDIYAYIRTFKSTAPEGKDATLNAIVEAAKQEKN